MGHDVLMAGFAGVTIVLLTIAISTLVWMVDTWRTPEAVAQGRFPQLDRPRLSFSLLVPARHEQLVLGRTVRRLLQQDHPDFEVIVIVGHDDDETADVAFALASEDRRVQVVIDHNEEKNKPRALNSALPHCIGDIVGVFDAEDDVAPELLRHIDTTFRTTNAHVVQAGVQLMNYRSSWWSLRNVLEYFFWFSSRLHFHARAKFIPLGGNTVFVRADLLEQAGGWDPNCLAEDCELGVRLSSWGARVAVAFEAPLATREETPPTLRGLVRQRTRWNQGYLQVLKKGEWRRLPTRGQRSLAVYLLCMPFAHAIAGAMVPISLATMLFFRAPVAFVLLTFLPLLPTLATVAVECVGLHMFGLVFGQKIRIRDYAKLILGTVPYQLVLAFAAVRASVREIAGKRGWEKTDHVGAHFTELVQLEGSAG
jgi:glycosyltransferase XagB